MIKPEKCIIILLQLGNSIANCVTQIHFDIKICIYFCCQNDLRALLSIEFPSSHYDLTAVSGLNAYSSKYLGMKTYYIYILAAKYAVDKLVYYEPTSDVQVAILTNNKSSTPEVCRVIMDEYLKELI